MHSIVPAHEDAAEKIRELLRFYYPGDDSKHERVIKLLMDYFWPIVQPQHYCPDAEAIAKAKREMWDAGYEAGWDAAMSGEVD